MKSMETETYSRTCAPYPSALSFMEDSRKLLEDAGFKIVDISFYEDYGFDDGSEETYSVSVTGKREFKDG